MGLSKEWQCNCLFSIATGDLSYSDGLESDYFGLGIRDLWCLKSCLPILGSFASCNFCVGRQKQGGCADVSGSRVIFQI